MDMPFSKFLGPMLLEAGQTHEFKFKLTEIDPPFRGKWLITATKFASAFELVGLFVNDERQGFGAHPVPMGAFGEESIGVHLGMKAARMGDTIKAVVKNVSDKDTLFCAVLMGDDGEDLPSALPASSFVPSVPKFKLDDVTRENIKQAITKRYGDALATVDVFYVDEHTREHHERHLARVSGTIPIEDIVRFVVGAVENEAATHTGSSLCSLYFNVKDGSSIIEDPSARRFPFIVGLVGAVTRGADITGPDSPYNVGTSRWLEYDPAARATIERYLRIHNLKESDVEVREFVIGYGPTMIPRNHPPTLLHAEPQVDLFIPRRLIVPASVGSSFQFHDVRVGKNSQFENAKPIPASDLDENAPIRDKNLGRGPALKFKNAAKLGHKLSLSIENVVPGEPNSKVNHDTFSAAIIGIGVEIKDNLIE